MGSGEEAELLAARSVSGRVRVTLGDSTSSLSLLKGCCDLEEVVWCCRRHDMLRGRSTCILTNPPGIHPRSRGFTSNSREFSRCRSEDSHLGTVTVRILGHGNGLTIAFALTLRRASYVGAPRYTPLEFVLTHVYNTCARLEMVRKRSCSYLYNCDRFEKYNFMFKNHKITYYVLHNIIMQYHSIILGN